VTRTVLPPRMPDVTVECSDRAVLTVNRPQVETSPLGLLMPSDLRC